MLKLIKMECPACGAMLKKKGLRTYKCLYCNTAYILDMDVFVPVPVKEKAAKGKKNGAGKKKTVTKVSGQNSKTAAYLLVLAGVMIFLLAAFTGVKNKESKDVTTKTDSGGKTYTVDTSKKSDVIQSDYFKEFVRQVYGKEADEVSSRELKEINLFVMHDNEHIVDYRRNDGETVTLTIPDKYNISYEDLSFFPGIRVLSIGAYKDKCSVIHYLPNLEELTCEISPYRVLQYLENPKKLKKLSCSYYEEGDGIGELSICENLEDLALTIHISSISNASPPDLSEISKLSKLETFYLDQDDYMILPFLSDMKNLKSINLHCEVLKDISFLKNMPDLESLTLVDCDILSVENLQYTPNLKVLRLEDCYQIDSYLPVENLVNLEELMLSYHHGQVIPDSFKNLTRVTRLTLDGFNDLTMLSDFPNLTFLQLYACNYAQFDRIACMRKLEELRLGGGSSLNSVAVLATLPKLEKVDCWAMNTSADTELLFAIPNLKELNLNDTEFVIDLNRVKTNESLEVLYMENLKWSAYNTEEGEKKYDYANWEKLPMGACIDFLTNFPNLRVLSIQQNKIGNIEFTESLTKLESLDITSNYVSDITVLNKLPELKEVYCGENPLDTSLQLDERIKVDYSTKATERWPFLHYDW